MARTLKDFDANRLGPLTTIMLNDCYVAHVICTSNDATYFFYDDSDAECGLDVENPIMVIDSHAYVYLGKGMTPYGKWRMDEQRRWEFKRESDGFEFKPADMDLPRCEAKLFKLLVEAGDLKLGSTRVS